MVKGIEFFYTNLFTNDKYEFTDGEYKTLLKDDQTLLKEAEALVGLLKGKLYTDLSLENKSKILDFISQKPVFDALVTRQGKDNHDTKSLIYENDCNVWNALDIIIDWSNIWSFVYKKNILYLDYYKTHQAFLMNSNIMNTSSNLWGFLYKGKMDSHLSALWPVSATPPNGMSFANKAYFQRWHTLKG